MSEPYPRGWSGPDRTTWQVTTAGIVLIVWGSLIVLGGLVFFVMADDVGTVDTPLAETASGVLRLVAAILLAVGGLSLVAGLLLLRRSGRIVEVVNTEVGSLVASRNTLPTRGT